MGSVLAIGVGVVVLALLAFRYRQSNQGQNESAEKELYRLCRGDKEMVERLIALEEGSGGNKSRAHAAKAAVYSFKRDNR